MTIYINGKMVAEDYDALLAAGGANRATSLVFDHIEPQHGIISIRLVGSPHNGTAGEAMIQALEVTPEEQDENADNK
jgi:hypothetical protein